MRLVAVRVPESTEYRFYLTNIDPDSLDAHAVGQTYAARWQIELIFKGLWMMKLSTMSTMRRARRYMHLSL